MLDLIQANKRRTATLIAVCIAIILVLGLIVGLLIGEVLIVTVLALLIAGAAVAWAYLRSDAMVLQFSRAVPADPAIYFIKNQGPGAALAGKRYFKRQDKAR